jgi:hypothetical protein
MRVLFSCVGTNLCLVLGCESLDKNNLNACVHCRLATSTERCVLGTMVFYHF